MTTGAPAAMIHTAQPVFDQNGRMAQLHGIGVLRVDDTFYAWGEEKSSGGVFTAIACYSSTDFVEWRAEGESLSRAAEGDLGPGRVVERPKVLFNAASGLYVMFIHVDSADYSDARVGYATSRSPSGPYEYRGSERPMGNLSRDIGVFQEGGVGYLLSEDRENGLHIYRLADDYLSVVEVVATTLKNDRTHGYESPALVRHDGLYFLFGSDLTGWSTNDNKFSTAESLSGPWSPWRDLGPPGSHTFDSQISTVVPISGALGTAFVYVGDRWNRDDLFSSMPVWLPLNLDAGLAELDWHDGWSVDVEAGAITVAD